jgi:hypothetical protein
LRNLFPQVVTRKRLVYLRIHSLSLSTNFVGPKNSECPTQRNNSDIRRLSIEDIALPICGGAAAVVQRVAAGWDCITRRTPRIPSSSHIVVTITPAVTGSAIVIGNGRVIALGLEMAHLAAVAALDLAHYITSQSLVQGHHPMGKLTVTGQGTVLGEVPNFVTVSALDILWVARLGALARAVAHLIAVATLDQIHVARLGAFLGHVALLATVTAAARTGSWAVPGKVTRLNELLDPQLAIE